MRLAKLYLVQPDPAPLPRLRKRGRSRQLQLGNCTGINVLACPLMQKRGLEKRIEVMYPC